MPSNLFSLSLFLPAIILTAGLFIMVTGILRHNTDRFRRGLYYSLAAGVVGSFVLSIRLAVSNTFTVQEIAVLATGGSMFLACIGAISYHYIHRVLPDFFVNSSLVFSVACWLSLGVLLAPSQTAKASQHSRMLESHEYKAKKMASEATFASQTPVTQMPQ